MENASKALIIAGAILLAILIIALGILVYNQAAGTVDEANLDSEELQTFNSQYLNYEGTQSASTCKGLVSVINASNQAEAESGRGWYTGLNEDAPSGSTTYSSSSFSSGSYTVELVYTNGYVSRINIT